MSEVINYITSNNTAMVTATATSFTTTGNDEQNQRLEKTTVCLPIVRGSIAHYIGAINKNKTKTSSGGIGGSSNNNDNSNTATTTNDFHTHQWTLYVRGPNNEDLSSCISKVIFQLHPSFAQPIREVHQPPYEVTEKGWGEFEAQIRIIWNTTTSTDNNNITAISNNNDTLIETMNTNEQSIVLNHFIRLYPQKLQQQQPSVHANTSSATGVIVGSNQNQDSNNNNVPVVSEIYDEVVFTDPTESFFRKLQAVSTVPTIGHLYTQQQHFCTYTDTETFHTLLAAQEFLQNELALAKQRYVAAQTDLQTVDETYEFVHRAFASSAANEAAAAALASTKPSTTPSAMMSPLLTTKGATTGGTFPMPGSRKIPTTGAASTIPLSSLTATVPTTHSGKIGPVGTIGLAPMFPGSGPVAIGGVGSGGTKPTSSNKKKKTSSSSSNAAGGGGGSKKKSKSATNTTSMTHTSSSFQQQPPTTKH